MMEYLIANFESFANTYVTVLIEIYLFLVTILLACWLKPFMDNGKAAYVSATAYYILGVINNHTGTGKDVDRILVIGIIAVGIVAAWLLDGRRNPIQKIFLFIVFRLISRLSIELFSEVGFWEGSLVVEFDWYKSNIEATTSITNPTIRVRSVQKERVFIINVRNTIDHKVTVNDEGLPDSSKHESGHGYGLRNIKSIAGKYKGDIEIRQKESDGMLYFILNIMLMGK